MSRNLCSGLSEYRPYALMQAFLIINRVADHLVFDYPMILDTVSVMDANRAVSDLIFRFDVIDLDAKKEEEKHHVPF